MNLLKAPFVRFLQWSEQYTKTDMNYLARGGSWLLAGYVLQIATGLILSVAFANILPKQAYGTYQFILSLIAIVSIFTLTGIGSAIARATASGSEHALPYGFQTQLRWSIGIVFVSWSLATYYILQDNTTLGLALIAIGLFQPLIIGFGLYKWYLQARGLFRQNVLLESTQRLVPFVSVFVALFYTQNPLLIIIVFLVSSAISLGLAYTYTVIRYRLTYTDDPSLQQYGKHLSVMESMAEIAGTADKALVWVFLGATPLATYALALLPVTHLQSIFGLVHSLAFPKMVKRGFDELKHSLPLKIVRYFSLIGLLVTAYILAAPTLFALLFPAYPEAVIYTQVLALALLATPRGLIRQAFTAHEKKRELYITSISIPVVRLLLLVALVPGFGIWGVIAAILITETFGAMLLGVLFARAR